MPKSVEELVKKTIAGLTVKLLDPSIQLTEETATEKIQKYLISVMKQVKDSEWGEFRKLLIKQVHPDKFQQNNRALYNHLKSIAAESKAFIFIYPLREKPKNYENLPDFLTELNITSYPQLIELVKKKSYLVITGISEFPHEIAAIFTTHTQFIEFASKQPPFASLLIDRAPEKIAAIFKSSDELMELIQAKVIRESMLSLMINAVPDEIIALFTSSRQFRDFKKPLARVLLEKRPAKIAELFKNYTEFMDYFVFDDIGAWTLIDNASDTIAGLFTSALFIDFSNTNFSRAQ